MENQYADDIDPIDRKTSRSICEAVGERLQQTLRPDSIQASSYLEHLLDELQRREEAGELKSH